MKLKRLMMFGLPLVVLIMAAIGFYFYHQTEKFADEMILVDKETIFTIPAGAGRVTLEKSLVDEQIIPPSSPFNLLLKLEPSLANFKAGSYRLQPKMQVKEMLALFSSGKEAQFSIRFIEGSKLADWDKILQDAPYLKQELANTSPQALAEYLGLSPDEKLEGWFYPDTYLYTAGTSDLQILKRAHQQMKSKVETVWKQRNTDLPYATPYEMLIMASIIEKETGVENERKKVASVFINRLRKNMRLQTDPTVIYGIGDKYNGTIYRSDLNRVTPYNTYQIDGLPPTPIAMPGMASLEAAANPAQTDYIFFVADGKGGHTFTTNLQAHNKAVNIYRNGLKNN